MNINLDKKVQILNIDRAASNHDNPLKPHISRPSFTQLFTLLLRCVVSAQSSSQIAAWPPCVSLCKKRWGGAGRRSGGVLSVSHRMGVYGCVPCPLLGVKLYSCAEWRMYHFCVSMKRGQVNLFRSIMQDIVAFC